MYRSTVLMCLDTCCTFLESWYSLANKAGTGNAMKGSEKEQQVSKHINTVLRYVPYVQTKFVQGLDVDQGAEPIELTKQFVDMTPGAFPGYSLLTAFGQAAPLNLDLQRAGRVSGFPFHFLNNNHAMNVRPKNYEWREFYRHVIDLTKYSFSWRAIGRRLKANRAISTEGFGRIEYHTGVLGKLENDRSFRKYFEGESDSLPQFYVDRVKRDLGPLWGHLPDGALYHAPHAYLNAQTISPLLLRPVPGRGGLSAAAS